MQFVLKTNSTYWEIITSETPCIGEMFSEVDFTPFRESLQWSFKNVIRGKLIYIYIYTYIYIYIYIYIYMSWLSLLEMHSGGDRPVT